MDNITSSQPPAATTTTMRISIPIIAFLVTLLVHGSLVYKLDNNFLRYDDLKNFQLSHSLKTIWMKPAESSILAVWEPTAMSLKLLTSTIFSRNTRLIHSGCSVVLFALTMAICSLQNSGDIYQLFSVLLFALSQNRVEILGWVSCQSYVLALFFATLFTVCWSRWRAQQPTTHVLVGGGGVVVMLFALTSTSKAAALPVFLYPLVTEVQHEIDSRLDAQRNDGIRPPARSWQHWLVFLLLLLPVALFTGLQHSNANHSLNERSAFNPRHATSAVLHYFEATIHPISCVHYFHDNVTYFGDQAAIVDADCVVSGVESSQHAASVVVVIIVLLCLLSIGKSCTHAVATLTLHFVWFIILASPGIVAASFGLHGAHHGGAAHDRYSLLSEALVVVPLTAVVLKRISTLITHRAIKTAAALVVAGVIAQRALSLPRVYSRWNSTATLWENALVRNPNDVHALLSLGELKSIDACDTLMEEQQQQQQQQQACEISLKMMERALSLMDISGMTIGLSNAHFNYGTTLYKAGRKEEALVSMETSLTLSPHDSETMDRVLRLSAEIGKLHVFMQHAERSVKKHVCSESTLSFLHTTSLTLPDNHGLNLLSTICAAHPLPSCFGDLGQLLHGKGRVGEAVATYEMALGLANSDLSKVRSDVVHNLGIGYYQLGKLDEASKLLLKGVDAYPSDLELLKTHEMLQNKILQ